MTQTLQYLDVDLAQQCLQMAQVAQQKMRQCEVISARRLYDRVINKDLIRLFFDSGAQKCHLSSSGGGLPLDKMALYLVELMFAHAAITDWRQLVYKVLIHDDFVLLPANDQCLLHAAYLYSQQMVGAHDITLDERAVVLRIFLNDERVTGVARIVVLITLGAVYRQLRDKEASLTYLNQAKALATIDEQPFYAILVREEIGSTTYYLNEKIKSNYLKAIEVYKQAEALIDTYGIGYDFAHHAYNLGWVYAEIAELEIAMYHFRRGLNVAIKHRMPFEQARYQYGMGYVYLSRDQYDEAQSVLLKSLEYFMPISAVYNVACLNLLAHAYKYSDIDLAFKWIENAEDNLALIDHPTQKSHVEKTRKELYELRDGRNGE